MPLGRVPVLVSSIGAALTAGLRSSGATVITTDVEGDVDHHLDVRDLAGFRALVAEAGAPDLLLANAGISMGGPAHELGRARWDRTIDVNLNGVVNGVLAVYPGMVERGSGHIVATASGAGLAAPSFVAAYATTTVSATGCARPTTSPAASPTGRRCRFVEPLRHERMARSPTSPRGPTAALSTRRASILPDTTTPPCGLLPARLDGVADRGLTRMADLAHESHPSVDGV